MAKHQESGHSHLSRPEAMTWPLFPDPSSRLLSHPELTAVRMDCGTINIVGAKIQPKLMVRVDVFPEESSVNIVVEGVELEGSEAARVAGGAFNGERSRRCSVRQTSFALTRAVDPHLRHGGLDFLAHGTRVCFIIPFA